MPKKRLTQEEVDKALESHKKWLNNERRFFGLFRAGKQADFRDMDLSFRTLSQRDLRGVIFSDGKRCADLSNAHFDASNMEGCDLRYVNMNGAWLEAAYMRGAYMDGADLTKAYAFKADMIGCSLKNATLEETDFQEADLQGVDLRETTLTSTRLVDACLADAHLEGVRANHVDFGGANLLAATITDAVFVGGSMKNANLKNASLAGSSFSRVNFNNALLTVDRNAKFENCFWVKLQRERPRPTINKPVAWDRQILTDHVADIKKWDEQNTLLDVYRAQYTYNRPRPDASTSKEREQTLKSVGKAVKKPFKKLFSKKRDKEITVLTL